MCVYACIYVYILAKLFQGGHSLTVTANIHQKDNYEIIICRLTGKCIQERRLVQENLPKVTTKLGPER